MAHINVTTDDGVLVERIDAGGWDLGRREARQGLLVEVLLAVQRADREEAGR